MNNKHKSRGFVPSVLNWYRPILVLWLSGVIFFSICLIRFLVTNEAPVDNSVSIWFQQNDPGLVKFQKFNKDFGEAEWTLMVIKTKSIQDKVFLTQLEKLTEEIEAVPNVQKAISLANRKTYYVNAHGKHQYRPLYQIYKDEFKENIRFDSLYTKLTALNGVLYQSGNDRNTAILIKNDNLIRSRNKYRVTLLDSISTLTEAKASIQNFALTGTTVINAELNRAAEHDAVKFYVLVTILLILFSLITLKYFRDGIVLIAIVAGTIIPVMGGLALFGIPYNLISIMLPTLLLAFSVADIVHVIDLYHKIRLSDPGSIRHSLDSTIQQLWKPGLWTSVSTVMGLVVLSSSDVFPIFQIGIMGPIGILIAYFQTMIIGPILLRLLWHKQDKMEKSVSLKQPEKGLYQITINWITSRSTKHPRKLISGFIIMMLPILALPQLEVDTNYADFFRSRHRVPMDYKMVKDAGFSQNPLSIQLSVQGGRNITSPGVYQKILIFEQKLKSLPEVNSILSASPLLSEINKILSQLHLIPEDSTFEKIGIKKIIRTARETGNQDLKDFVLSDLKHIQIMAMTDYLSSKELIALKTEIHNTASACFQKSEVSILITGSTTLWASMDKHISNTQLQSIVLALGFMALFLPVVFKSIRWGILGLIINFLPISVSLGVMALSGIKINIATALIGSIAFGIVVDDTIHFIARLKNNMELGLSVQESISETLDVIGHSIITTTFILVGSFITLSSSTFLPISHFGIFIALSVSLALYLDIFILPIFVRYIYCRKQSV